MLTIPSPDNTTCHFALLIEHALCWRTIHSAFWDQPIKVEQRCHIGKAQIRSGNKNCGWSGALKSIFLLEVSAWCDRGQNWTFRWWRYIVAQLQITVFRKQIAFLAGASEWESSEQNWKAEPF